MDTVTVRTLAEAQLGDSISQGEWHALETTEALARVVAGHRDINWLTERVWDLRELQGTLTRSQAEPPGRTPAPDLERAIGRLVAEAAAGDIEVQRFRRDVLHDRLLSFKAVPGWIATQRAPATRYIRVPLPPNTRIRQEGAGLLFEPSLRVPPLPVAGVSVETLEYLLPGSIGVRRVPTTAGQPLDWLRRLSERLARVYGWERALATIFVLTGLDPPYFRVRVGVTTRGRGQITITADPTGTPREIATAYQRMRRQLFGRRLRRLSPKHTALAAFLVGRPTAESWEARMKAWNARDRPKGWQYPARDVQHFRRDALEARRRLDAMQISLDAALRVAADTPAIGDEASQNRRRTRKGKSR